MPSVAPSSSPTRASVPLPPVSSQDPTTGASGSGFINYMSSFLANGTATQQAASPQATGTVANAVGSTTTSTTATSGQETATNLLDAYSFSFADSTNLDQGTSDVTHELAHLGYSQSDIASILASRNKAAKLAKNETTSGSDTTQIQNVLQTNPQLNATAVNPTGQTHHAALQFTLDPISAGTAAQQAIAALSGQETSQTAATIATAQSTATQQADAAKATLAQQGVVSINGQLVPSSDAGQTLAADAAASAAIAAHTIATQTGNPTTTTDGQAAADVASAAIKQQTTNMPMSRMAEIRAKLQAAQLGSSKANASASATANGGVAEASADEVTPTETQAGPFSKVFAALTGSTSRLSGNVKDLTDGETDAATAEADGQSSNSDQAFAGLIENQPQQAGNDKPGTVISSIKLNEVASTVIAQAKNGTSEFRIRLDPAGLGGIDVKMQVSSDGQVRAHMIVDQPATLDLMMRDQQQLSRSLDQAGFKTDPGSLQFSLRDQGQGQSQQQSAQSRTPQPLQTSTSESTTSQPQTTSYVRPTYIRSDGVDLSV